MTLKIKAKQWQMWWWHHMTLFAINSMMPRTWKMCHPWWPMLSPMKLPQLNSTWWNQEMMVLLSMWHLLLAWASYRLCHNDMEHKSFFYAASVGKSRSKIKKLCYVNEETRLVMVDHESIYKELVTRVMIIFTVSGNFFGKISTSWGEAWLLDHQSIR